MIDTLHLLPPDRGPRSNPTLYGVAEAIAALFPLPVLKSPCREHDGREAGTIEPRDERGTRPSRDELHCIDVAIEPARRRTA